MLSRLSAVKVGDSGVVLGSSDDQRRYRGGSRPSANSQPSPNFYPVLSPVNLVNLVNLVLYLNLVLYTPLFSYSHYTSQRISPYG